MRVQKRNKHIAALFEQAERESDNEHFRFYADGVENSIEELPERITYPEFLGTLAVCIGIGLIIFFSLASEGCQDTKTPAPAAAGYGQTSTLNR